MQDKRRVLTILSLLLAISILIFLVFLVVIMIYLIIERGNGGECAIRSFKTYQVQQVDPYSEDSTIGIARIPSSFEFEEEYLSYSTEGGNPVLISNFGSKNYHCSASCVCEDYSSQRRTTGVLTSGISVLLVALSLTSAFHFAKSDFDGICKAEHTNDDCPPEAVSSVVDDCHVQTDESPYGDLPDDEYDMYLCGGGCVDGDEIYDLPVISISNIKPGFPDCEAMDLTMNVKIKKGLTRLSEEQARVEFLDNHLKPYCSKTSVITIEAGTNCCRASHKVPFCSGGNFKSDDFEYNHSVFCQKTV